MQKKQRRIIIFVLAVVIVGGFVFLENFQNKNNTIQTDTKPSAIKTVPKQTRVILTKDGFSPPTITIKKGEIVYWENNSGELSTVNSADHPTHKRNDFLNLGTFEANSSLSTDFEKTGTYNYHNHYNDEQMGTIIVTD
jgi:plastocyanin